MPIYAYKAVTDRGQIVANKVEDASTVAVLKRLKSNKLIPIEVKNVKSRSTARRKTKRNEQTNNSILKTLNEQQVKLETQNRNTSLQNIMKKLKSSTKISMKDITVFTQNFYLLKKANFNNIHALTTVLETIENEYLQEIIKDILLGVEAGEMMYVTMEYYADAFPPIYTNIIRVGEQSGSLTNALEQAIEYMETTMEMNKKIKGILVPNLLQFFGLLILLVIGSALSVPMIQNTFDSVGSKEELPKMTMMFSHFLDWISVYWYIPVSIIAIIVGVIYAQIRTPKGTYKFHLFKYKMPVFGKLIYSIDFSRLSQAILLNLKNGMRIQEALETSKHIVRNVVMLSLIETSINNIIVGQSWIEPFEQSGLSTPMITEMLKIGMQTDLTEMMEKMVAYMQIEIDNALQRVMKVLPQIVYAIVGIMIIFVTVVVLVPLIQVYMGSWMFSAFV